MKAFGIALICKNIQEEVSFNAKVLVACFLFSLLELTLVWKKKLFLYHWIPTSLHLMCSTKTFKKNGSALEFIILKWTLPKTK